MNDISIVQHSVTTWLPFPEDRVRAALFEIHQFPWLGHRNLDVVGGDLRTLWLSEDGAAAGSIPSKYKLRVTELDETASTLSVMYETDISTVPESKRVEVTQNLEQTARDFVAAITKSIEEFLNRGGLSLE